MISDRFLALSFQEFWVSNVCRNELRLNVPIVSIINTQSLPGPSILQLSGVGGLFEVQGR